ncbi:g6137 [Coccomyxa viridis]|uniref:G6137 protein n=1 Tax=Coccomyxa viridis TaxID=1274662 RepID=A0ABP1FUM7_9CHLO
MLPVCHRHAPQGRFALLQQRQTVGGGRPQTALRARQRPQRRPRQSEPVEPDAEASPRESDGFSAAFDLASRARSTDVQPVESVSSSPALHEKAEEGRMAERATLSVSSSSSSALSALTAEIVECSEVDEILEVVSEEAGLLTGEAGVLALHRLAQCPREQHSQLRVSAPFTQLLALLEKQAFMLTPKEVAQALWSLAKLRQTRPKLVARLAAQAGQIVDKLNGRDISTIVWAFGSMRSKMDPALLQSLSSAAVNLWDSMEPQGISMLMSGLAKLDAQIDGEMLDVASASLQAGLPQYGHQAVANTFYSLARLQHYSAQLCAAVDTHVSESIPDFTPQELMNTLWAFVQYRYQPKKLLARLDETVQQADQASRFKGADWASMVWGFASLGAAVTPAAAAAISQHSIGLVQSMNSSELCNLSWGLGVMDLCDQPIFEAAFEAAVQRHSYRSLEPRLLRQLLQAAALAEAAGVEVSMPEQTRRTAAKWWGATRNIVPSLTHSSVSQQLRQQGVPHKMLLPLGDGLPTIDIAIQPKTGSRSVAVQVMGPHEMSANTRELLGRAKAEARLLEAHGWTPVHVIVGGNKSLAKQLQKIAQAFGDPRVKAALQHQSSQSGSRTGVQQPAAGAPRGSKLREGWVQWQAPKKDLERQEAGEPRISDHGQR